MKRALLATFVLTTSLLGAAAAQAATLSPGDLIKGPGDAVYYYGQNGKRYVFPNLKTYQSWYPDFSTVKTVTAGDLAQIQIGGNVTYRPGVKLVKITTDPKTYAVSSQGVLRWIQTEAAATALYGADWNKKVDDIADPFFINYTVGMPIANASDYAPAAQTSAAVDINTDKKLTNTTPTTTTPPPTQTTTTTPIASSLDFTVSNPTSQPGNIETLNATYKGTDPVSKIELYFNGMLVKTCALVTSCAGEAVIPVSGTQASYVAEARATKLDATVLTKDVPITIAADGSSLVHVTVGQSMIASGQAASVAVTVEPLIAVNRIDISVDGTIVKGCASGARLCQWSDYLTGANGSVHPVFARVTDNLGRLYTSSVVNITIGVNDLPGVTVEPAKTTIYAGEMLDVTVSATDNDGIASVDIMRGADVLKHCDGAAPCTASTGPWTSAGTTLTFSGRATDTKGNVGTATAMNTVMVVNAP